MKCFCVEKIVICIFFSCFLLCFSCQENKVSVGKATLSEDTFRKPDKNHYPETWFHFIGGNVSKEGITADLEEISAAGISGIQLFHGQFGGEWPGVSPQIQCLSESWDDLILWTARECKRLNLTFTMQNCPGWSYAGGPWITPENSMRHLVYSRTDITANNTSVVNLEKPQPSNEDWRDYKDLFVLAFPTPEGDTGERLIPSKVTTNRPNIALKECILEGKKVSIPPTEAPTVIDIYFDQNTTVRTIEFPPVNSFSHAWSYSPDINIAIYADVEGNRRQIAHLEVPPSSWQDDKPISIACEEVSSQSYQIQIRNLHDMALSYIHFFSGARQQNWESEAAWTLRAIVREDFPKQSEKAWIDPSEIIDITSLMDSGGVLSWEAPAGQQWTVLRIGHINTGMKNAPAPPEATGWECNKLDAAGIRANFDGYIGRLINENGVLSDGMLQGILLDSWECRTQTWTSNLDRTFQQQWDYSLFSMFPALFGYVVDNPENTARFLRDWRVTLNDLLVENFFGEMKNIASDNGLKVSFETASGDIFPGDILEYYKYADIPMCEFWQPYEEAFVGSLDFKPVKPCVSATRVYGKKRTAAEAFTSFSLTWDEHPRFLKDYADYHLAQGVTHLVFHTYTHNPRTDFLPPSTSFGSGIGTPFLRLQTWWKHMPYFTDYLARCNYMLESGRPISDVLMYLGDEQNHKPKQTLDFPEGYAYDYCNPDVLLNRLAVKNGKIVTPEGLSYQILWLYDCKRMLPETLEKIYSFLQQGITIVGEPPVSIATLSGGGKAESRFNELVKKIWGEEKQELRSVGKGRVYRQPIDSVLISENIRQDVNVNFSDVRWLHRQTNDADFYFLSTPENKAFEGNIVFRSSNQFIEWWDPLTGEITVIEPSRVDKEQTEIGMSIPEGTTCFIVFRKEKSAKRKRNVSYNQKTAIRTPWEIQFPTGWGIENSAIKTEQLKAWKDLPLTKEGKSFSGTAVYTTVFDINDKNNVARYLLDLGRVEVIAKVILNGKEVDTKWTYPYQMDITEYIHTGENTLNVEVTSTWFNRLVYDAELPEGERKTWTIRGPGQESQLKDYGLFGPVYIHQYDGN